MVKAEHLLAHLADTDEASDFVDNSHNIVTTLRHLINENNSLAQANALMREQLRYKTGNEDKGAERTLVWVREQLAIGREHDELLAMVELNLFELRKRNP